MYTVLIDHPEAGLLLWEVGPGKDYPTVWGAETSDAFGRKNYEPVQELDAAIASTGHSIDQVKAVIMGHLHLDHAGGLTFFKGTQVPIYCHERELKNAYYAVATKADLGIYLPHYLDLSLNWQTFNEKEMEFARVANDGTFLFTSDQFHVKENYLDGTPPGWVTRDHNAWFDSLNRVRRLARRTNAMVVNTKFCSAAAPEIHAAGEEAGTDDERTVLASDCLSAMSMLKGAVGIITGAGTARGLGRSAVLAMSSAGARAVYACDLRFADFAQLQRDVKERNSSTEVVAVQLDVSDEQATISLCKRIVKDQGRLDFWCANAGIVDMQSLWSTKQSDFRKAYDIMTLGPYYAIKYGSSAMSVLSENKPVAKGSIIVTGSIASVSGGVASIAYTAAKHAAAGIAKRGAVELAKTQIRVNTLAPGLVATKLWQNSQDMSQGSLPSAQGASAHQESPDHGTNFMNQVSQPEEIADIMAFLASDRSSAINAQVIVADRGALEQGDLSWSETATAFGIGLPPALDSL
ncbi:hypothetical protein OIV83_004852 [Microbotryomycetes sp. JL201]|nr:hypothetical protein OIV83_004852 [Microbotryomycetes sp. JL201]